ncbi:MAG: hypothetical protein AAB538_04095 [Patescibacteria group bacterium]
MLKFWKKKPANEPSASGTSELTWDAQAQAALDQAVSQAPVPKMMKSMVKSQLKNAAEDAARKAGHTTVTPQDLMEGMLSKMPAGTRAKVEEAMKKGPEGIKDLERDLKNQKQ